MIYNLFAYPSNFGQVSLSKCNYFGTKLSLDRYCFVDKFSVNVEQQNVDDNMLFGGLSQTNNFKIGQTKISINADFIFALNHSGVIDPAIDLLFNLSAWSYQGTNISYKLTIVGSPSSTSLNYAEQNVITAIGLTNNISLFDFYAVNSNSYIKLNTTSIDNSTKTLYFTSATIPANSWLEIFKRADEQNINTFPLYSEPMFRIDSSEGSFYSCLVDKINITFNDDYVKVSSVIMCNFYDRSTRNSFVNTVNVLPKSNIYKALHKSRVQIKNYTNDIANNFLISYSSLQNLSIYNSFITTEFENVPIRDINISIDNNLEAFYGNNYSDINRIYVKGYVSKYKKISGSLSVYMLRGANFSLDRFPFVTNNNITSISIIFGTQSFSIPYTVWKPGKIDLSQNNYVEANFEFNAISNQRLSQPQFTFDNLVNT